MRIRIRLYISDFFLFFKYILTILVDFYVCLSRFIFCYPNPDQQFLEWIQIRTRPNDTDPAGSGSETLVLLKPHCKVLLAGLPAGQAGGPGGRPGGPAAPLPSRQLSGRILHRGTTRFLSLYLSFSLSFFLFIFLSMYHIYTIRVYIIKIFAI